MKQSRLPEQHRRTGYRSPGRRELRKLVATRALEELFTMRGNVPRELEEDREFFKLFQEWKKTGAKPENPITAQLRARAAVVMGGAHGG